MIMLHISHKKTKKIDVKMFINKWYNWKGAMMMWMIFAMD
jgi:hypothetical protein